MPRVPSYNKRAGIEQPSRIFSRLSQGSEPPPYGVPPLDWEGTLPEWAVMWAFQMLKIEDVIYQAPLLGGRMPFLEGSPVGIVADFYVPSLRLIIPIQTYWHYQRGDNVIEFDKFQREVLESKRFIVVYIDSDSFFHDFRG